MDDALLIRFQLFHVCFSDIVYGSVSIGSYNSVVLAFVALKEKETKPKLFCKANKTV